MEDRNILELKRGDLLQRNGVSVDGNRCQGGGGPIDGAGGGAEVGGRG